VDADPARTLRRRVVVRGVIVEEQERVQLPNGIWNRREVPGDVESVPHPVQRGSTVDAFDEPGLRTILSGLRADARDRSAI
jgi:hypothetical protein